MREPERKKIQGKKHILTPTEELKWRKGAENFYNSG